MKCISTFMILVMLIFNIHADEQKKINDILQTITSIQVDHLDLEALKQLESNLQSIVKSTNTLQKKVSQQKSKLQEEEKLIKILSDASQKKPVFIVLTAIANLEQHLKSSNNYFQKAQENKITQKHIGKVKEYQQTWQKLLDKLTQLQKHVLEIENANEDLKKQTLLKDTELQKRISSILQSTTKYNEYLQVNDLSSYKSHIIASLEKDLQARLARSVYTSKVKFVREAHLLWKNSQMQDKSSVELTAIKNFEVTYKKYEKDLQSGSENNFFSSVISPLMSEAHERKRAIIKENELFTSVEEDYKKATEITKDVQTKLEAAKNVRKKITEYEQLVQGNEISSYHRKNTTPYARELDKIITSISQEIEMFNSLQKNYTNYQEQKYENIITERNKIDDTLKKVVAYANLLQTERIKGYYSAEVKKIAEALQKRQEKVVAEQSAVSPFRIAHKNWQEKNSNWDNAQNEKEFIEKVINSANNYSKTLEEGKISTYYKDEIQSVNKELTARLAKINKETTAFAKVAESQMTYKQSKFDNLDKESAAIDTTLSITNEYAKLSEKKAISNYNSAQVEEIKNSLQNRQKILNNEKVAFDAIQKSYSVWKDGEKNTTNEINNITKALTTIDKYNSMIAKFEASQFLKNKVIIIAKELNNRKDQIELEKKAFSQIQVQLSLPQATTLQEYSNTLQKLKTAIANYQMELKAQKISDYHRAEVAALATKNEAQIKKLNNVVKSFKTVKASYNSWKIKSRWQSWEQENKKLQEIKDAAQKYKTSLGDIQDSNAGDVKTWLVAVASEQNKLNAEKKLFDNLKALSDTVIEGGYSSGEDELAEIEKLLELCDNYVKQTRAKAITNHYQRVVRQRKRKAQDASKKIKREIYVFGQIESSYNFWKNNSPWQNKADEERALTKTLAKVQEYNDELQFRKITTYRKSDVSDWKNELQKRQDTLRSGG
ncbi:hypothetical protein [Candidatus Uabimicrobium sp. HlEnr_7]|uniref:hypothetical protein n=1 Tax=Candidatus Uabimicrobium helgolandensis TaxID=3095367 RepID=UPI003558CF3A